MGSLKRWAGGVLGLALVLVLAQPAAAQSVVGAPVISLGTPGGGTAGRSAFSGGAGAFSGRLTSSPLGFRPIQSVSAFPGSVFPPTRTTPNMQVGVITANPVVPGLTVGNPVGPYPITPPIGVDAVIAGPSTENLTSATNTAAGLTSQAGALVSQLNDLVTAQAVANSLATPPGLGVGMMEETVVNPALQITLALPHEALSHAPETARPLSGPLKPREDLQQIIARSSSLPSKSTIRVMTNGSVVVLRGSVSNEAERRVAEALLRLSPEVLDVRNELTVQVPADRTTSP